MNRRNLFLIVGAAALVAIGTYVLLNMGRTSPAGVQGSGSPPSAADLKPRAARDEIARVVESVQGLPISAAARKRMIAAWLETTLAPEPTPYTYWEAPAVREARNRLVRHSVDEATRREVRKAMGDSVQDDPEFAFLFQPYRDRYPFLSPAKQLEMQALALGVDRALVESGQTPIEAQGTLREARKAMLASVEALLTKDELEQYQRRDSPAALTLANSGFKFTQAEFDAVYPTVSPEDASIGLRRFDAESTARLKEVLGEARFVEYRKVQDPMYRMLSAIVASHGRQNADLSGAYQAIYENQEQSVELQRAGPVLSMDGLRKKQKMSEDLRATLVTAIGQEATDIFLRSMESSRSLAQVK